MSDRRPSSTSFVVAALFVVCSLAGFTSTASGQEAAIDPTEATPDATAERESYPNNIAGEFTPARGFDIIETEHGSLNISAYGVFRWINQTPGEQTFTDHLGRERDVKARNDLNWHRTIVWLTGFLYKPELRYMFNIWSLPTTQQSLIFGSLSYTVARPLTIGVGIAPNLCIRSMQGSFPFWASSDRQMSEEFFRGGFASGVFVRGEPFDRFHYNVSLNTNLSQLGVTATEDSRDMAYSASVSWLPTTGEFGPRGGFGDLEHHQEMATRFGMSAAHAREDRAAPVGTAPKETQLRLSDGVLLFEDNALGAGITLEKADYDIFAADASLKYRGFSFKGEYYHRTYSNFQATAPTPMDKITDTGFMAEAMHMVIHRKLGLYVAGGYVFDEFERNPWEFAGGASFYPYGNRAWRINLHVIRIEKSPTSSNFGFYTAGQSGTTISIGTDIML